MNFKNIFILIALWLFSFNLKAEASVYLLDNSGAVVDSISVNSNELEEIISSLETNDQRPNPILFQFKKKQRMNKKLVAAALAFPFPFGIVGLHRIYLGTAPHVPIVYIGTFGGVLGILPFIDFCILVLDKDIDHYMNNNKIFMWVK